MSNSEQFMRMDLKGTVMDCHERFPITFAYGQSGTPYFAGARIHVMITTSNGKTFERKMEVRAFGEVAEQLAHVQSGDEIHVRGVYDEKPNKEGARYFPIVTIDEVVYA